MTSLKQSLGTVCKKKEKKKEITGKFFAPYTLFVYTMEKITFNLSNVTAQVSFAS